MDADTQAEIEDARQDLHDKMKKWGYVADGFVPDGVNGPKFWASLKLTLDALAPGWKQMV